jgi:predicted Zn-dependent protease
MKAEPNPAPFPVPDGSSFILPTSSLKSMALDLPKLRKLLSLDPGDPLSRFALGKKLFETDPTPQSLAEAAKHLRFANAKSPDHLATYDVLSQVLILIGEKDEARRVLEEGIRRTAAVGEGMGRDLGPKMRERLDGLA